MHIFSFANGQIVGHWNVLDLLTLMMQLGVVALLE
jgi:predicted ester cyclase